LIVTPSSLVISLLGQFSLTYRGEPVRQFSGERLVSLLAYLLLHRHTAVSRQQLAFTLWPNSSDSQARTNLRNVLHTLRQTLPEADTFIEATFSTLRWRPDTPYSLDVAALIEALAATKAAADEEEKRRYLETAVLLYEGELLPGNYDDWIVPLREELRQIYLDALQQLIALLQGQQAYRAAARYAQRLVQQDPLDESAYVQLMCLHALSGNRAGVHRVYEQCAAALRRELDVEPDPATQDVYQQLTRHESPPLINQSAMPIRQLPLPTPATPFIGRDTELAQIAQRLADPACRLLTIVGPGGMGKTRLALQTAVGHKLVFPHGAAFVDLTTVHTGYLMAQAIAARLSLPLSDLTDHRAQLAAHLKDKETLLVLDNMEHLLSDVALLSDLLAAAPGLKLLVTSRQRLELPEEWVFDLHGFPLPDGASPLADNGGVALFVQAAQRVVNHQFVLTAEDETAVTRICQLVGGMPLGLQLAATWVRVLSCAEIAQEIEHDLDFLSTRQRHLPERQRSLRAVFDYSWQLLSDAEQAVCSRLALFRGGFSREAAQAVAGAALPVLSSLVDRALVNRLGDGRYDMHELVQQYAAEHLPAQPEALLIDQEKHAAYFLQLATQAYNELQNEDSLTWFRAIDQEVDNFRAALGWALQANKLELGLRLGSALRLYWWWRGYLREGLEWLEVLLTHAEQTGQIHMVPATVLASVYMEAGLLGGNLGLLQPARAFLQQSLDLYRQEADSAGIARALNNLGFITSTAGQFAEAEAYSWESMALHRATGDFKGMVSAYLNLGTACLYQGKIEQSVAVLDEALALARQQGHRVGTALLLSIQGNGLRYLGKFEPAQAALGEAHMLLTEMNNRQGLAANLYFQGWLALDMGMTEAAATYFRDSLELHHQVHNSLGSAAVIEGVAELARRAERPLPAIHLLAAAAAIRQKVGAIPPVLHQQGTEETRLAMKTAVGNDAFDAAWCYGQQLSLEETIAIAREQTS
jgi:predicted ATPase/DNA-binding SARP family transcriptional activator